MSTLHLRSLGPGLVFAAAAIGVSHLVQSTRAGALYGLGLVGVVLFANLIKYPAFRFGPLYAAATGTSLLEGYRRQGRWALWAYALVTLGTMFGVLAAVSLMTTALLLEMTGWGVGIVPLTGGLLAVCAALLAYGRYALLETITRVLMVVLAVSTLAATLLIVPTLDWGNVQFWIAPGDLDLPTFLFVVALVGWMPSAIDISVWNSLWTLARREKDGVDWTPEQGHFDFHVGYLGTALIALAFVLLGTGVLHGSGTPVATSPAGFAAQVISLYRETLGEWSAPLIRAAAFATMFSTTLAVMDGFPRALATLLARFRGPELPGESALVSPSLVRSYWVTLVVLAAGALLLLALVLDQLTTFVDLATTLSFLTAPVLAWLNHRAMHSAEVPEAMRPPAWLRRLSLSGVVFLTAFALTYIGVLFVR